MKLDFSIFLWFFFSIARHSTLGLKLIQKPKNTTFIIGHQFFLNCSTDEVSSVPIDWYRGKKEFIYAETLGENNTRELGFSVEKPDNYTINLVAPNPNATYVGRYCCQAKNGDGDSACAYVKIESPLADEVNTTSYGSSDVTDKTGIIVSIGIGIVVFIFGIVVGIFGIVFVTKRRSEKKPCSKNDNEIAELTSAN